MFLDTITLVLLSFAFGFFTDFADLLDEHGLRWFTGAATLFGVVWGVVGALLVLGYPLVGMCVTALVFYWIIRMKLDYINHALGGSIVLVASLWASYLGMSDLVVLTPLIVVWVVCGLGGVYIKQRRGVRYATTIAFLIPPLALSLFFWSVLPVAFFVLSMLGMHTSDLLFRRFERWYDATGVRYLGLHIEK